MFWVVVLAGEGRAQAMHHILILDLGGSAIHAQIVHTPVTTVVAQISTSNHNDLVHDYDTIDCTSPISSSSVCATPQLYVMNPTIVSHTWHQICMLHFHYSFVLLLTSEIQCHSRPPYSPTPSRYPHLGGNDFDDRLINHNPSTPVVSLRLRSPSTSMSTVS
jgi:hypothetical protein